MVQGGDISEVIGSNQKSYSMFEDGEFADESFSIKHKQLGLVGMSQKRGCKNSNECKFYITLLAPVTHLNSKNVAFGRVVSGFDVFQNE